MRIFIASSNDLEQERKDLEILLFREKFEPVVWENIDHSITNDKFQNRINDEHLTKSDIVIFMVKSKLGEYTQEEFEEAYKNLGKSIKKMYIYFFDADKNKIDKKELRKILSLQEFLENEGNLYQEIKDFIELKGHFLEQKKFINNDTVDENIIQVQAAQVEVIKSIPKICIYTASPLNNNFEYHIGTISNIFRKYNIEVFHRILNEDNLLEHYDYDYNLIFTHTNKEKIIIEDEFFMQKSIMMDELQDINNLTLFLNNSINNLNFNIIKTDNKSIKKILTSFAHENFKNQRGKYNYNILQTDLPNLIDSKNLNNFIGRDTDLEIIIKKILTIKDENKILTIKGSGGLGKTTIISKAVDQIAKRGKFKDGIKFVQCEYIKDYEGFENKMTFAFDMNNAINFKEQLKEQSSELEEDERRLIILDNVETILNINNTQKMKDLIRFISDYATIVITSREVLNENDYEEIHELKALTIDESEKLFLKLYEINNYDKYSKEDKNKFRIDLLENLLNYNPLAIKLVATNMMKGKTVIQIIEELKDNFFEITKKDIEDIFYKESDINIEKTYSLFGSINYSYINLKSKEKLALEILSLFPDGLHISNLHAFYNKKEKDDKKNTKAIKHKIENFSDKDIKSLEDKSLVINTNGFINLQSIIGRFSEYHFNIRDKSERIEYYKKAFSYNNFVTNIISNDIKSASRKAFIFDNIKNNLLKSLDYLQYLEYEDKQLLYLDSIVEDFAFTTIEKDILIKLDKLRDNYNIDETTIKFFDLIYLKLRYFYGDFNEVFKILQKKYPVDDLINKYNQNILERNISYSMENIYTMEGYTIETIRYNLTNTRIGVSELFQLGEYSMSQAIYHSKYYNAQALFFQYEFLFNKKILEIKDLERYVNSIYKTQLIEKVQSTYTLLKADISKVKLKDINKLIISNPFTNGLKILMKAIKDEKNCSKNIYEEAIEQLYHIKYYYIEAILKYCKYLKDNKNSDYNQWFEKGKKLAHKYYYRYLLHQFICLDTGVYTDYNEDDYPLPEKLDYSKIIKKYNLKGLS